MSQYDKLKVADLKDLIKQRGITATGLKLKQQLIDALVDNDARSAANQDEMTVALKNEVQHTTAAATEEAVVEDSEPQGGTAEDIAVTEGNGGAETTYDESEPTNKRKRRSSTPPVIESVIHKRLKTAEEADEVQVKLPEDMVGDAPMAVEEAAQTETPLDTDHNAMEIVKDAPEEGRDALDDASRLSKDQPADLDMLREDTTEPVSKHPNTRALYIRELIRPLQPNGLREHLLKVAQPMDSIEDAHIEAFHLDKLRSHAFALFDSVAAASRARTALHNQVWPNEPMRKALWVDYVPSDKVQEWIDIEVSRADMTRWEVVYSLPDIDAPVIASHQEVEAGANTTRKPSRVPAVTGEGMPNAPLGPRGQSTQLQQPVREVAEPAKPVEDPGFNELDQMFRHTETKPKIYFQNVSRDLADKRLDEIDRETSRTWDDADADPSAYAEGELRRYTFEDGDKLVDGGADFGLFGRRGRGGRGGGGGGGGGRGRGGDYYRGGSGGGRRR